MGHLDSVNITCPDWDKAIKSFENVISSGTESMQLKATVKLAHLSKYAPHHILAQTIPILAKLLVGNGNSGTTTSTSTSSISSNSIQEVAVYCLKKIACQNGALASLIGQSGVIDSILGFLLLQSSCSFRRVLIKCLCCLVNFSGANRLIVAQNGGLEIIVNLLNSCSDGNRVFLLEILSALTLLREVRRVIIRLDGLRFLIEAVRYGSMVSRERACQAVGLLGVSRRAKSLLVASGAIPVLVELLRDGDGRTKLVAGNSLGIISAHVDFIRAVADAGAVPLYAELLEGTDPLGKEIAEDAFCILAVAEMNAIAIAEHLVRILIEGDDESKIAASDVFWDLSGYKHLSVVRNSGAIPVLVELLRDGSSEVREKVSGAIAQLSYNEADRAALADAGVVPILIGLLLDESDELKENAAESLVNFAEDPRQHDIISEAVPSFESMQNRVSRLRVSDENMARSMRQMSIEQLTWDPDLA